MAVYTNVRNKFQLSTKIENKYKIISEKVLQLISYFDSFDYPITFDEIVSLLNFEKNRIWIALNDLSYQQIISHKYNYYFIPGKEWTIGERNNSMNLFLQNLHKIIKSGWILSHLPFVRGLLLTGSASKEIMEKNDDFDFLVIAEPNHIWLCRLIIEMFRKLISKNFKFKNYRYFDCNYIISQKNLTIKDQNEFTAIEIFFAKPIFSYSNYKMFIEQNKWIKKFFKLPKRNKSIPLVKHRIQLVQSITEKLIKIFLTFFYRNNRLEKYLYLCYYNKSLKRNNVSCLDDYKKHKSLTQIKNSNNTQPFMLQLFRHYKKNESRNKLKTKLIRKLLVQQGNNSIIDFNEI